MTHVPPAVAQHLLTTQDALRLLAAYQDCSPAHRELLVKLAEVLSTNRYIKRAADEIDAPFENHAAT